MGCECVWVGMQAVWTWEWGVYEGVCVGLCCQGVALGVNVDVCFGVSLWQCHMYVCGSVWETICIGCG